MIPKLHLRDLGENHLEHHWGTRKPGTMSGITFSLKFWVTQAVQFVLAQA